MASRQGLVPSVFPSIQPCGKATSRQGDPERQSKRGRTGSARTCAKAAAAWHAERARTNGCNGRGNGTKTPAWAPPPPPPRVSLDHVHLYLARRVRVPRRLDLPSPAPSSHQSLNAGMPHACWPWALPRTCTWHLCYYQKSNVLCECQRKSYYGRRSHLLALAGRGIKYSNGTAHKTLHILPDPGRQEQ
jgi:hypothetical protein